jgi:hypothetical protein
MARTPWLDSHDSTPLIDDYAKELTHFIDALADGKVEQKELDHAESRLVKLLKEVEPTLDDATHEKVTRLLCEVSAYSIMQILAELKPHRPHAGRLKL